MTKYPELVTKLTTHCNGWLVGSAANPLVKQPRDYDIFIPIQYWFKASSYIPKNATINRLGGFKCISEDLQVDVWTGEMHDILASNYFTYAYHPKSNVRIKREWDNQDIPCRHRDVVGNEDNWECLHCGFKGTTNDI